MPTGHRTEPDVTGLLAALDDAHTALRAALAITFDHDDRWPERVRQSAAAKVEACSTLCRTLTRAYTHTPTDWVDDLAGTPKETTP